MGKYDEFFAGFSEVLHKALADAPVTTEEVTKSAPAPTTDTAAITALSEQITKQTAQVDALTTRMDAFQEGLLEIAKVLNPEDAESLVSVVKSMQTDLDGLADVTDKALDTLNNLVSKSAVRRSVETQDTEHIAKSDPSKFGSVFTTLNALPMGTKITLG